MTVGGEGGGPSGDAWQGAVGSESGVGGLGGPMTGSVDWVSRAGLIGRYADIVGDQLGSVSALLR